MTPKEIENRKERARERAKAWYYANKSRVKESREKWYSANKEKARIYNLEYREKNRESLLEYDKNRNATDQRKQQHKKWRDSNPEKNRARVRQWAKDNPERAAINQKHSSDKRRLRISNAPFEKIDRDVVYMRDCGVCGICGQVIEKSDFTIDHIVPISKGGGHVYPNVHSAHSLCNKKRGNRPLIFLYSI